jgi:AAA+ ATPase superfamily predicted ATPase
MLPVGRKPGWVFDRDFEWDVLVNFAGSPSPRARLEVVSGRHRQGKTFLLRALAETVGAFYYAAAETTAAESLRDLGGALAVHTGGALPYAIGDWGEAIRALRETFADGLVIIDEFPYLIRSDPSLPSLMQRTLDDQAWGGQQRGTRFLLCSSAMSVMGGLLAGNAPLRGRSALELVVAPFDYRTAARFWGIESDPALAVLVHSIVGGTPAYRAEFVADDVPASRDDFDGWVARTVLNPAVPLFREARYLLAEETDIREPALYNSVLGAIAAGNATRGGIANYVGRKSSELMHPLTVLEDAGLITRERHRRPGESRRLRQLPPSEGRGHRRHRYRSLASEVLARQPGQGEVGDLAPSVIEDERVPAVRERVVVGDRARAGVELVGGPGDHLRHGVVLAAASDQQRPAVPLAGVDGSRGRLLEVRGRGLEQRLAGPGDRVLLEQLI